MPRPSHSKSPKSNKSPTNLSVSTSSSSASDGEGSVVIVKSDRPLVFAMMILMVVSHLFEFDSIRDMTSVMSAVGAVNVYNNNINKITNATRPGAIPANLTSGTQSNDRSTQLPSCVDVMKAKGSPYKDGAFLTRHSIPIFWTPRPDGSRELRHSMCQIHRYTAEEARQCLAGHHVHLIGDSLTRYQFFSLVHFLHKNQYPPRFGTSGGGPCLHVDEFGQEQCSKPPEKPNVCLEREWEQSAPPGKYGWMHYLQNLGGPLFDGYMETSGVRAMGHNYTQFTENHWYVSPHSNNNGQRPMVSYSQELGWTINPTPIHGFSFTGCAKEGKCSYTDSMEVERTQKAAKMDFDFSQDIVEALTPPNGALLQQLPPVDIALYNRGHWGGLTGKRANEVMTALHQFSQGPKGRCFFKSTTNNLNLDQERGHVRMAAWTTGCGYLDFGHLAQDLNTIPTPPGNPPGQSYGQNMDERKTLFWDSVHFTPWVYEELNNVMLNVLCNAEKAG